MVAAIRAALGGATPSVLLMRAATGLQILEPRVGGGYADSGNGMDRT